MDFNFSWAPKTCNRFLNINFHFEFIFCLPMKLKTFIRLCFKKNNLKLKLLNCPLCPVHKSWNLSVWIKCCCKLIELTTGRPAVAEASRIHCQMFGFRVFSFWYNYFVPQKSSQVRYTSHVLSFTQFNCHWMSDVEDFRIGNFITRTIFWKHDSAQKSNLNLARFSSEFLRIWFGFIDRFFITVKFASFCECSAGILLKTKVV